MVINIDTPGISIILIQLKAEISIPSFIFLKFFKINTSINEISLTATEPKVDV